MPKKKAVTTGKSRDDYRKGTRTRNWLFVVYPDSAPENWREIIKESHVPFLVSPLHDKDINATGEAKKPHWHVVIAFSAVKTMQQVQELTDKINSPMPIRCESLQGSARYLTHRDNPEKAQYDSNLVEEYNGASYFSWAGSTVDAREALKGIFAMIRQEDIRDYDTLMNLLTDRGNEEYFIVATELRTLAVTKYLDSRRMRLKAIEEQERNGVKISAEKRLEAYRETDYLQSLRVIIEDTISKAIEEENIPPNWRDMRKIIKGVLVDNGYSQDALEEYCSKKGVNLKKEYEAKTGYDIINK